jgi:hypothetical protein
MDKQDLINFILNAYLRRGEGKQYEIKPKQQKKTTIAPQQQQRLKQDDLTMDDQIEWIVELGNFWKAKDIPSFLDRFYTLSDHSLLDKDISNTANKMISSLLQIHQTFVGIQI